jgi:indolepyruvate ferredoxin oxidoreductase beta subunit
VKRVDVVLSGVGGQGILTLAALMGTAAVIEGYDVRVSEVHGMAQRGGSVVCHVKIGERVSSPLVIEGLADMVLSLELSETARVLHYLKPKGIVVVNINTLPPPLSIIAGTPCPNLNVLIEEAKRTASEVYALDAIEIAKALGSPQSANVVMLGATWATGRLPLSKDSILKAMARTFSGRALEENKRAFEEGAKVVEKLL